LYLVLIAWGYVALMMTLAEILSPQGTVLGALITLVFYGVVPMLILGYILNTRSRRQARRRSVQQDQASNARHDLVSPAVSAQKHTDSKNSL
jgi:hypothetical protein